MSTVDPSEVRRQKAGSGPGRERMARRALGCYLAGAATSVVLGTGVALLFDTLRSETIMPLDAHRTSHLYPLPGALVIGVAGLFLLGYASELDRRSRGRMHGSGLAPFLGSASLTAGVVIAILAWWSRPAVVGRTPDPFGDEPSADWGGGSWLLYTSWWWLPALLAMVSVAALLAWRRAEGRAAAAAALRDLLLAHGARTTGVVTDARVLISTSGEGGRQVAGAIGTVRFTAGGVERWVERRTRDASAVVAGAPAEVLYDPADPAAEQRIFVAFVRDPALSEWIPAASRTVRREGP
ncbi:MAG: hypothetical protein QM638_22430 [Nocardioides sp.]|uniref:DUF3592 domain-containing protein n=1 Tax=Nocardioides sp. TaxID=35761 RepID=UPI0039E2C5BE